MKILLYCPSVNINIHEKPTADATLPTNGGRYRYVVYVDIAIIETARVSVYLG